MLLVHHGLHVEIAIDASAPIGATDDAGVQDLLIESALTASRGGVTEAAVALGIARKTLYDKLARNGIDPARFR